MRPTPTAAPPPAAQPEVGGEAHLDGRRRNGPRQPLYAARRMNDDWSQPGALCARGDGRWANAIRFVENISGHLADGVSEPVLKRAFAYWRNVDKDIGDRIRERPTP